MENKFCMKHLKLVLFALSVVFHSEGVSAQSDIKPYVIKLDGSKIYHEKIIKKQGLLGSIYVGTDGGSKVEYKRNELKSAVHSVKPKRNDSLILEQYIFVGIKEKLKQALKSQRENGLIAYKIDTVKNRSTCTVFYAKGDTMIIQMTTNSSSSFENTSHSSSGPSVIVYYLLIDERVIYLHNYFKENRYKCYELLKETFDNEKLSLIFDQLKDLKSTNGKKYKNAWSSVRSEYYFNNYIEI